MRYWLLLFMLTACDVYGQAEGSAAAARAIERAQRDATPSHPVDILDDENADEPLLTAALKLAERGAVRSNAPAPIVFSDGKPPIFKTTADKKKYVAEIKSRLAELKKSKPTGPKITKGLAFGVGEKLKVGDVGVFEDLGIKEEWVWIRQILNEKEAIASFSRTWFLLRGVSTNGWADDERVLPKPPFEVTGTYRYQTADGGSRTIMVLEPYDPKKPKNTGKLPAQTPAKRPLR